MCVWTNQYATDLICEVATSVLDTSWIHSTADELHIYVHDLSKDCYGEAQIYQPKINGETQKKCIK